MWNSFCWTAFQNLLIILHYINNLIRKPKALRPDFLQQRWLGCLGSMLIFLKFLFQRQICWDFVLHASAICMQIWTQKHQRTPNSQTFVLLSCQLALKSYVRKKSLFPRYPNKATLRTLPSAALARAVTSKPLKPNQQTCFNTVGVCGRQWAAAAAHSLTKNGGTPSYSEQTTQSFKCKHNRKAAVVTRASSCCCQFDELLSPKTMRAHKHRWLFLTGKCHWEACGLLFCLRANTRLFRPYLPEGACLLLVSEFYSKCFLIL